MGTTHCRRGSHNRCPHRNHFLTALLIAAMVMILTLPAFAVEAPATTNTPDTEVSVSMPDLLENPADEDDATPASAPGPVSTLEELLDAIANANANDVIEFDASIQAYHGSNLVLGRIDCPVTLRRTTSEARLSLGGLEVEDVIVQNITFDGAGVQSNSPILFVSSPTQFISDCNFINCIGVPALVIDYNCDTNIQDCNFANNTGAFGAHIQLGCRNAHIGRCTFTDGFASDRGPVYMRTQGKTEMSECTISGNTAGKLGGGIYIEGGELSIYRCKIYGNTVNGVANDITKDYTSLLSLADSYTDLVELYKSDGVVPNRWTVDSHYDNKLGTDFYRADMIFSMTFADNEPSPPPSPTPTSVTLDKSELTLDVGETGTLTATLYPEGTIGSVQWTSSDPAVASVAENGFITAHSPGTAVITATETVSGISASCHVNVQDVPATTYSIGINASPVEGGTVNGGGQYEEGTAVTVTAVPNEDFRFLAWTEADTQISTEASLTFTVTSDRTLTAIFEPISKPAPKPIYTINTSAAVGGTVSGAGKYEKGSSVTLTATTESGYRFIAWTENNEQISVDESFTFIADRDRTIAANFARTYTINISAAVGGTISTGAAEEGTVSGCGGYFLKGSSMTYTAIPDSGYLFAGWTENGEQVSVDESITIVVDRDRTLVANFKLIPKPTYTIQVNSTQGGVAEGGGNYEEGKLVTVNAVPDADYRFLRWEENGVQVSTEARYSFAVEADRTLVSVFEPIPQSESDSTNEPSYTPGTPSASHGPKGDNVRPVTTSMASLKEIQIPTLAKEKAVLIAPDDSFWVGYKAGRDNGMKTVTRADFAQLVYSMMDDEGRKIYGATRSPFRDIEPGAWYGTAVGTMLNTGIMVGCGDGLFCPNRTLTWGELLTVFARFAGDKPPTEYYTGSHWAKNAVNKAFTLGWLEYSETFNPGKIVTTGEMTDLIQAVFRWSME